MTSPGGTWEGGDSINWRRSAIENQWWGTVEGICGTYTRSVADFRKAYPEAPRWDG